jgi:hypothetical protein
MNRSSSHSRKRPRHPTPASHRILISRQTATVTTSSSIQHWQDPNQMTGMAEMLKVWRKRLHCQSYYSKFRQSCVMGNFNVCAYNTFLCSINQFLCSCKWLTEQIRLLSVAAIWKYAQTLFWERTNEISISRSQLREEKPREVLVGHMNETKW